jgi:hypothetical protein
LRAAGCHAYDNPFCFQRDVGLPQANAQGLCGAGWPSAAVFLTRHLPTGKVFFLQKNVKNGKKGAIY